MTPVSLSEDREKKNAVVITIALITLQKKEQGFYEDNSCFNVRERLEMAGEQFNIHCRVWTSGAEVNVFY